MLEVKDACVSYGKSRVVNGISLKIDGAETFLVLGRKVFNLGISFLVV